MLWHFLGISINITCFLLPVWPYVTLTVHVLFCGYLLSQARYASNFARWLSREDFLDLRVTCRLTSYWMELNRWPALELNYLYSPPGTWQDRLILRKLMARIPGRKMLVFVFLPFTCAQFTGNSVCIYTVPNFQTIGKCLMELLEKNLATSRMQLLNWPMVLVH